MGADLTTFEPGARRHVQSRLAKAVTHAVTLEDAARAVCRVVPTSFSSSRASR